MFFVLLLGIVSGAASDHAENTAHREVAVSLCEIAAHPQNYSGSTIRVQANLLATEEFAILADDACPSKENPATGKTDDIEATFKQGEYRFNSAIDKRLARLLRKKHKARVVVIGVFVDPGHYVGHQLCCRYQLDIQKLLSVREISKPTHMHIGKTER